MIDHDASFFVVSFFFRLWRFFASVKINFFERRRRARISAESSHRRGTRLRLRTVVKDTREIPTGYLQAPFDTIEYDRESHKVSGARAEHDDDEAVLGYR